MDRLYSLLAFLFYSAGVALFCWIFKTSILDIYELTLHGVDSTATIIDSKVETSRGKRGKTKYQYRHLIRYDNDKTAWINLDKIYRDDTELAVVFSKKDHKNVKVGFSKYSFYERLKTKYGIVGVVAILLTLSFLLYNCIKWILYFVTNKQVLGVKSA